MRPEIPWFDTFKDIGVITVPKSPSKVSNRAEHFIESIMTLRSRGRWKKRELVELIIEACPELEHVDTGRYLDDKM